MLKHNKNIKSFATLTGMLLSYRALRTPYVGLYMKSLIATILVMLSLVSFADEALECHIGPMQVSLGNTKWQLTSCNDGRSLVFATMQGNPAMPFVFFVQRNEHPSKISGEGNGSKEYSAAAFEELKAMTEARFDELVKATKLIGSKQ